MPFKVECGIESYRIIGPLGQEGELYTWDQIACLQIGDTIYYCVGEPDDDEQPVMKVASAQRIASEVEYVKYDGEEDEEDGADDNDADDDDEDEPGPELVV